MYSLCGDAEEKKKKMKQKMMMMMGEGEIFSESHESSCTIINKFEQPLRPKQHRIMNLFILKR